MTAAKARERVDVSAYLVVGPENTEGRPVREIVVAAVAAGFTCVQIRSKEASARELIALTREAAEVIAAAARHVTLLVDDRLDVVLAAESGDLPADLQEVANLLPPGNYTRTRLCDQLNSIIGGHAWGQVYGTVE